MMPGQGDNENAKLGLNEPSPDESNNTKKNYVKIFYGSDDNIPLRLYQCAISSNIDNIVSVDGDSDRGVVSKFSKNMLAKDTKAFREYIKTISPDLDLKYDFVSEITGEAEALDIPFGISFFYPSN